MRGRQRGVHVDLEQGRCAVALPETRPSLGMSGAQPLEHPREIPDHPARIMTTPTLLQASQPQRQRPRQPKLISDLRQQRAARMRDQTRSVRLDFYGYPASITHHPQGEPPKLDSRPSTSRRIAAPPDVSAPPAHPGGAALTARSGLAGAWRAEWRRAVAIELGERGNPRRLRQRRGAAGSEAAPASLMLGRQRMARA